MENLDNPNARLDPQTPESSFAHMTTEECAEYNAWLDMVNSQIDVMAPPAE